MKEFIFSYRESCGIALADLLALAEEKKLEAERLLLADLFLKKNL